MGFYGKVRSRRGFTLIEIVLVLAIAALLLLIVFLAVSGAQKSRRDYQRKQDLARMFSAIEAYAANNGNNIPIDQPTANAVYNNYTTNMNDPSSGTPYNFLFRALGSPHSSVPAVGEIFYQQAHWCSGDPGVVPDAPGDPISGNDTSPNRFVIWTGLEQGGWYCLDNN